MLFYGAIIGDKWVNEAEEICVKNKKPNINKIAFYTGTNNMLNIFNQ